jgi:hypothetical protein
MAGWAMGNMQHDMGSDSDSAPRQRQLGTETEAEVEVDNGQLTMNKKAEVRVHNASFSWRLMVMAGFWLCAIADSGQGQWKCECGKPSALLPSPFSLGVGCLTGG